MQKEPNDIRISAKSRTKNVIQYASSIMEEKKLKELKFTAVGNSIPTLISVVEALKIMIPGLYQMNKLSSVSYQILSMNHTVMGEKISPKMEVILSTEKFKECEGSQDKYDEKTRKDLEAFVAKRREEIMKKREKGGFRGRGFRGRGFRGRGFRGRGFRGRAMRGGSRGRGAPRGRGNTTRGAVRGRATRGTK